MEQKLTILPLRLTRHSDRTMILSAYSREAGRVAFAVPAGGKGRLRSLLTPLNPLQCVTTRRAGNDLLRLREPHSIMPIHVVMSHPERAAMAMFLAEALGALMRQSEGDPQVFDYILDAVARLNDPDVPVANFHLCFLMGLGRLMGIAPDLSDWRPGMLFDMRDGLWRLTPALHGQCLNATDSAAAARLMRIGWANQAAFRFSRDQRQRALSLILDYYTLHLADLSSLNSPEVLAMVFG